METTRWLGLTVAVLAGAFPGTAEDIVRLVGANVAEICERCGDTFRFLVTPKAGVNADEIRLAVVDVALGNRKFSAPDQVFAAAWATDSDGQPGALLLHLLKPEELREQGAYDVTVLFSQKGAAPGVLKLQVSHPAAKLRVPGTLVIHRVVGLLWDRQETPALVLWELNGKSAATGIQLRTVTELIGPSGPIGARILFPHQEPGKEGVAPSPLRVEPGKSAIVPYTLQSGFPLGKVTGSVELVSPALADAVPMNIEVWSRRPLFWIIAFAIPGLVMGWFLKVFLQQNLEMEQARLRSQTLLQQVQTDLERRADKLFHDALAALLTAVQNAQNGDDAGALDNARQALEQAWRAALQDLGTRRAAAQATLDGVSSVVRSLWPVPNSVSEALAAGRTKLADAAAQMRADNVTGAVNTTNELQTALTVALDINARKWQGGIGLLLDSLSNADMGISPPIAAGFQPIAAAARAAVGKAQLPAQASSAQLIQFLHDLSEELRAAQDAVARLGSNLVVEARKALAPLLEIEQLPRKDLILTLLDRVTTAAAELPALVNDAAAAAQPLGKALRSVHEAWTGALLLQLEEAKRKPVADLLSANKYAEAARITADRLTNAESDAALTPSTWQDAAAPASLSRGFVLTLESAVKETYAPPALPAGMARTISKIRWTKFWQTLGSGFLLCLIARYTFADKFVGNFADFVIIFFWAFGLDLTLDSVIKNIPKRA